MDIVFTIIFLLELILKVLADGVILHPRAYLRNPWNWLDSCIVVISLLSSFGSVNKKCTHARA